MPRILSLIGLMLLVAGCAGTKPAADAVEPSQALPPAVAAPLPVAAPTLESMRVVGAAAATGDLTAIDRLDRIRAELYRDVGTENRAKNLANLKLMRAALFEVGKGVKGADENDPAFKALVYAHSLPTMKGFVPYAFGVAAAKGHQPSLSLLLNHSQHNILRSTATFALVPSAKAGNEQAINFLIGVIENDKAKPLWHGASQGLVEAAGKGNKRAEQALLKYQAYEKSREKAD